MDQISLDLITWRHPKTVSVGPSPCRTAMLISFLGNVSGCLSRGGQWHLLIPGGGARGVWPEEVQGRSVWTSKTQQQWVRGRCTTKSRAQEDSRSSKTKRLSPSTGQPERSLGLKSSVKTWSRDEAFVYFLSYPPPQPQQSCMFYKCIISFSPIIISLYVYVA